MFEVFDNFQICMSSAPSEEEVLAAILGGDAGESAKKTRKRKKKRGKGEEKAVDAEPGSGSGSAFEEELAWCVGQLELGLQRADAEQGAWGWARAAARRPTGV